MKNKVFKINEATILCSIYGMHRQYAKQKFANKLIEYQNFFGTTSIVGAKLSVPDYFQRKTVETVCNDLGYRLISFSNPMQKYYNGGNCKRCTDFTFVENNGAIATED